MSKTELKKLLRTMTAEDLAALVLELYGARKEAKEYLEFFINPDIDVKQEEAKQEIAKELGRVHRHSYSPRMSRIKASVKKFASYSPGEDLLCDLMTWTFEKMCHQANGRYFKPAFENGCVSFLKDTIKQIDKAGMTETYFGVIDDCIKNLNSSYSDTRRFRQSMVEAVETAFERPL